MEPRYRQGDKLLAVKRQWCSVSINDVIILYDPRDGKLLLKRVTKKKDNTYFVEGDNKNESTDSRRFGWIKGKDVIGKIIT